MELTGHDCSQLTQGANESMAATVSDSCPIDSNPNSSITPMD